MGDVRFVLGRSGAGKSRMFRYEIREALARGERNVLLIVPEQFTFETERELANELGGGLLGAQVLSISRMTQRVLDTAGGRDKPLLSRQGRVMAARSVIKAVADELTALRPAAHKSGFAPKCEQLISLFKQFDISPQQLQIAADKLDEGLLKGKLHDLARIYAELENAVSGRFIDGADAMNRMIERMGESFLCGARVYIDGFDALTGQMLRALGAIMRHASSVSVALCIDPQPSRDGHIFELEKRTYAKLIRLAEQSDARIEVVELPISNAPWGEHRPRAEALAFLERELFAYPAKSYTNAQDAIRIFAASGRIAEAEAVAGEMLALARGGMRFRDMAVALGDMGAYAPILTRVFGEYGIPFFMDYKRPLSGHPIVELLLCALRAADKSYPQGDVLRLVKTGLLDISQDEAEEFENYVLRWGIKGNLFAAPFVRGEVSEAAERARLTVMEPLETLRKGILNGAGAKRMAEAVYEYLERINLFDKLESIVERLREEQKYELMEENAQIWNILMELLDQLYELLGEQSSRTLFIEALEEGIKSYDVGVIPSTLDQVTIGDIERTKRRAVAALFVMGCNEGILPGRHRDDELLNDAELGLLTDLGLAPWQGSAYIAENEYVSIYLSLAKPTKRLMLSYALTEGGRELTPSTLLDTIRKRVSHIKIENDIELSAERRREWLAGERAGYKLLAKGMRAAIDGGDYDALAGEAWRYFAGSDAGRAKLDALRGALLFDGLQPPMAEVTAEKLYGAQRISSASRLETYAQCPFKHFMRYGLEALPRREYAEAAAERGTFIHDALDAFTRAMIESGAHWRSITREDCDAMLDDILERLEDEHNGGILRATPRMRALAENMRALLRMGVWAVVEQVAAGSFDPRASEAEFGPGKALPAIRIRTKAGIALLSGKIDRLDTCETLGALRIVDYKTGNTSFRYEDIYYGLKLQLPLYLQAAAAALGHRPAGAFYMSVKEPVIDERKQQLEAEIKRAFRQEGLVLSETEVVNAMDKMLDGESLVVNVRLKKDGTLEGNTLVDENELDALMRFAQEKAAGAIEGIYAGDARAWPVRRGPDSSACKYCDYAGVCGFDPTLEGGEYRRVRRMDKAAFLEKSEGGRGE